MTSSASSTNNYFFVEEPFKRKMSYYLNLPNKKFKIAGGEHFHSLQDLKIWKKNKCFYFYQPDSNLLLYKELNQICNMVGLDNIIFHNWCNKINFLSNINFAFSQTKSIILEKNILQNPYDDFFLHKPLKIKKGKLYFLNNKGFGIYINKRKKNFFDIYEKKL